MASLHGFAIAISDGILMPEKIRLQIAIHKKNFQVHSVAIMTIPLFICYFSVCHAIKSKHGKLSFLF